MLSLENIAVDSMEDVIVALCVGRVFIVEHKLSGGTEGKSLFSVPFVAPLVCVNVAPDNCIVRFQLNPNACFSDVVLLSSPKLNLTVGWTCSFILTSCNDLFHTPNDIMGVGGAVSLLLFISRFVAIVLDRSRVAAPETQHVLGNVLFSSV